MSRYVSFGVLLAVIAFLSILFYKILAGFLVPLFLASLLVVIFRPLHDWMYAKLNGRQKIAALLTTLLILLAVLIPLAILTTLAVLEGKDAVTNFNSGTVVPKIIKLRKNLGLYTPVAFQIHEIDNSLLEIRKDWGIKDIEYHQELWFEIDQNSKRLETQQKVPTHLEPLWAKFIQGETDAADLKNELTAMHEVDPENPENLEKAAGYHEKIDEVAEYFTEFKYQLLGGRILGNIRLLANPSERELAEYGVSIANFSKSKLLSLGGATTAFVVNLIIGGAIMIISLYFFLLDGPAMIKSIQGLSPLDDEHEAELVKEFGLVSRAVVVATLLSALVQGGLAGIGYYFCGFESLFLMTLLTTALALVPFFGAASVWIPACLYLFFIDNNVPYAIGLAIYGAAVVSMADNVIKPLILHGQSNLHPLLALLSILGGVSALGPVGLLVGPMVVVFLQTLLKILQRELNSMEGNAMGSAEPD